MPHVTRKASQSGAVAVEAAVCIAFILMPLLALILLFGRFFWYYDVAQKAAHDAALYMATAPLTEMKGQAGSNLALSIMQNELADVDSVTSATFSLTANCGYKVSSGVNFVNCNTSFTPYMVQADVVMIVVDPFFSPITHAVWGADGIPVMVNTKMRYLAH